VSGVVTDVALTSSSNTLFWRLGPDEARVLVFGNLQTGPIATLDVPDINAVASYGAVVLDVTDRDNEIRSSFAGYEITFAKLADGQ
jgi:hypothetical protein